ncbi:tetratricopeptide repeat protein [Flavobacterium sp. NRK1]|uniref:tetratricopeptide repeat protein n=1 Tax=Flavobacterium sp. NRK1 TaxID=2954929 RepID=UPI002092EDEC|nr:tetratricopeptide repeat protein [Flavobacterium sp. NRK1]MCO6149562.1 tetratricopeptide repeat protein [Flavobacterium sp. NRK1]
MPLYINAQTKTYCDSLIKKGQEARHNKNHVKSLELLSTARSIAEKNRWNKQLFYATLYTGSNYLAMMDYGEALNYYLEAYNLSIKDLGPEYEMIALNNIATLYTGDKNYKKAQEYYFKAYKTAKDENYKSLGIYLVNLANIENILNNPLKAKAYIAEAMPNLKKHWPRSVVAADMIIAESDLLEGKNKLAREEVQKLMLNKEDVSYNDIGIPLQELVVRSYIQEKDYTNAALTAEKILKEKKPDFETKKRLFEHLIEIYIKTKSLEKALRYKDSIIETDKKLNEIRSGRLFENSRVKFEMQDYKNQLAIKEEKVAAERKIIYSLLAIFIAVLTGTVFILRQKKLIAERNQRIIALELEKEKNDNLLLEKQFRENETNALLEQERLKNEIEARNRKLSAKALYLSDRNQLIEEILTSLSKKPKLSKDLSLANQIRSLKNHLKTDEEWDSFITHFEEVNHGFLTRLKTLHPTLTANDVRFIAYIYMNLSIKEIASILNITVEACRKRKDRLAIKMELPENLSLYDYISTL